MSASANWSFTSTATHWAQSGFDDWTGVKTWAAPVTFACDYKAAAKTMTDTNGNEFVSRQVLYTERSTIQPRAPSVAKLICALPATTPATPAWPVPASPIWN